MKSRLTALAFALNALALGALMVYPQTEWIRAVDLTRLAMN